MYYKYLYNKVIIAFIYLSVFYSCFYYIFIYTITFLHKRTHNVYTEYIFITFDSIGGICHPPYSPVWPFIISNIYLMSLQSLSSH